MAVDYKGQAWIYLSRATRARLNMYKILHGLKADSVLDQTETITALLDAVGAPSIPEPQPAPDTQAVRE